MRTLAPKDLAAIRAPGPVVEMGQLVVSYLGSCTLFWRCSRGLRKNFFFTAFSMFCWSCFTASGTSNVEIRLSIVSREPRNHVTALHSGVSRKDRAYGLVGVIHRAGR